MKLLLVAKRVSHAGTSRVLSLLSQEWAKQHLVHLAFFKPNASSYDLQGTLLLNGIPFPGSTANQIYALYRIIKKHDFDQLIGFSEDANYPLIIAAWLAGQSDKVTLTVHNPVQKMSRKVKQRIAKWYPRANKIITVSEGVRKGILQQGVSPQRVHFRPNPIDIHFIEQSLSKPAEWDIPNLQTCTTLIALGRLHYHKGFDLLIQAFSKLNPLSNLQLVIIGDGAERLNLESQIKRLNLEQKVFLPGALSNPFATLKQADIFILSSRLEGWPLVLMEAMAIGLPVISYDCPNGPNEILQHEKTGILVPPEDANALKSSIEILINAPQTRETLARNGQRSIQDYAIDKIAINWLE